MNYNKLDPGIRNVVRLLHYWGYKTTDSGDGVTKLDFPHVVLNVHSRNVLWDANFLRGRLIAIGIDVVPHGPDGGVSIQATYDPSSPDIVVMLMGLTDDMLPDELVAKLNSL
jgi:hypothetical protein